MRMNTSDLKEYLDMVVNMEKNIYMQAELLQNLKARIDGLGHACVFQRPEAPRRTDEKESLKVYGISIIAGIALVYYGYYITDLPSWIFIFGLVMMLAGIFISIKSLFLGIMELSKAEKAEEEYETKIIKYERACEKYEKNMRKDQERVQKENEEKAILTSELQSLQRINEKSRQTLSEIYSADIIFPKYRNLAMVCRFQEYIASGRCNKLEGYDGAYNLLENELRLDRISIQLNDITRQLNTRLADMEQKIEMQTYETERIHQELRYIKRMNQLSQKYGKEKSE